MADEFNPVAQGLVPSPKASVPTPIRPIAPNVHATGFDDETVRKFDFDFYKGRLNETDRIYILNPKNLIKVRAHYHDKLKSVRCNSTFEQTGSQEVMTKEAQCCRVLSDSQVRFGVLLLRYVTDRAGTLLMPFQPPEMRLWRISVDKYLALRDINKDFPLETVDLSVTCTEAVYQKMTIGAKPPEQCLFNHPQFPADLKRQIQQWVVASMPKLPEEMAKVMTDEEILKELGQATAAVPVMTQADIPMGGVFDDLVKAAAPASSAAPTPAAPFPQTPTPQ